MFLAVRHARSSDRFYGGLWNSQFSAALYRLGHNVTESGVDLLSNSEFMETGDGFSPEQKVLRGNVTQQIVDEVRTAHRNCPVTLFLCYYYNSHFEPSGFDDLHRLGITTVNFYCNSVHQFNLVDQIASRVQFSWHAEKHAREKYRNIGANPVWVQMGADPNICRPIAHVPRSNKACFVGQRYADRDRSGLRFVPAPIHRRYGRRQQRNGTTANGDRPVRRAYARWLRI